jgi:DNA-binding NarL/FixJ family response regulator
MRAGRVVPARPVCPEANLTMLQLRETAAWPTMSWAELSTALPRVGRGEAPLHNLSSAERVVAAHIAEGFSNREIAVALGKSEATVKNQVSAILHKLGVPTRAKLIVRLR